jgi:exopolysaccharide biosynthesis polyprenyl glycosylphosphotransferase
MHKSKLLISLVTICLDYLLVLAAFFFAYMFRERLDGNTLIPFEQFAGFAVFAGIVYLLIFAYLGLYNYERRKDLIDQFFIILVSSVTATTLAGALIYFTRYFDYSRLIIGAALIFSVLLVWIERVLVNAFVKYLYRRGIATTNVFVVGSGKLFEIAIRGYQVEWSNGYRLRGAVYLGSNDGLSEIDGVSVVARTIDIENLKNLIRKFHVHEVALTHGDVGDLDALQIINLCESEGVRFKYVPSMFDVATARVVAYDLAGLPVLELRPTLLDGWMVVGKRVIDLVLSAVALVLVSPILLITAVAIRIDSKGPIIFKHLRVGQNGKEFNLYKFRSMNMVEKHGLLVHANENTEVETLKEKQPNYKLENDPRVTRIGHFIRRTSIDELPQIWNVIRGEISLVGPRAYVAKELEKQQENYPHTKALVRRLLTVKPGITGLWQISGRSNIDFAERVAMDAYYATHANIWMDMKILLQTIPVVIKGSGAM